MQQKRKREKNKKVAAQLNCQKLSDISWGGRKVSHFTDMAGQLADPIFKVEMRMQNASQSPTVLDFCFACWFSARFRLTKQNFTQPVVSHPRSKEINSLLASCILGSPFETRHLLRSLLSTFSLLAAGWLAGTPPHVYATICNFAAFI